MHHKNLLKKKMEVNYVAEGQDELFTEQFLTRLKALIEAHHIAYPHNPPQGIYFESLVARAFRQAGWQDAQVVLTTPNRPQHDLLVGTNRISLKTETGAGTKSRLIAITKLCTTEREPWDAPTLIQHALGHLSRYDHILMLRAIWAGRVGVRYQLLEIPILLLQLMQTLTAVPVGRRKGRRSIGGDVYESGQKVFHVHFDGADGKCQIRDLPVERCRMLAE